MDTTNNYEKKQKILELQKEIYTKYSGVGGKLHIVLDDYNIENHHIEWCLETINELPDGPEKETYKECAELLLQLSYTARKRLLINH